MDKLRSKPLVQSSDGPPGRFESYSLSENPFPSEPVVNKESTDKRINGGIYEVALRDPEFTKIRNNFLIPPTAEPSHSRLGYIIDTSYIGRGNGKSAFLVHLQNTINHQWCLDISSGVNKCFALIVTPEPGGRTKTFGAFVDAIMESVLASHIIRDSLAAIRLNAIMDCYPNQVQLTDSALSGEELIEKLSSRDWYDECGIDLSRVRQVIQSNRHLQSVPPEFPLLSETRHKGLFANLTTEDDIAEHYWSLKKGKDRISFAFSHLVRLFQAADFTGSFVLVDDFERVPDFQGTRQRKDFALELRSVLYDGPYHNARIGFYSFLFVLHAGVPALISDAWAESGLENRSPLSLGSARHIVLFEKLNKDHVRLLLKRYLDEYRIASSMKGSIAPFTPDSVQRIGEMTEFNAAKILATAYVLLEKAAEEGRNEIDAAFAEQYGESSSKSQEKTPPTAINKAPTTDLLKKAKGGAE